MSQPNQTTELTALPQLYREMRLELRKRLKRAAPEVKEADGKFLATRAALTASGATREEAIAALKLLEASARTAARDEKIAARKAAGKDAADPDEDDDAEDDDAEDDDDEDEDGERDADSFDVSFSSETPVERWFGNEILDHSAGAIDLSRAQGGLAYLVDHNTRDQVGIIENLRTAGKKLRGTVRFSRSQRAQDIKRDLLDEIRPYTSIGYRVNNFEVTEGKGDAPSTYRATNWTPMEGSTVAVPADTSVGMGRAANETEKYPVRIAIRSASPAAAPTSAAPAAPAASAPAANHVEVRTTMKPNEVLELTRVAKANGVDEKRAEEILSREGITADVASREILAEIGKRNANVTAPAAENSGKMLELTERENKQFSVCRLLDTYFRNVETGRSEKCFELEVSQQIEKDTPSAMRHDGIFIPYTLGIDPAAARRGAALALRTGVATALTTSTATQGKELVFQEPGRFIDFLYNQMRLKALGAETVSGLAGNPVLPKQTGKATGSWVGENPGTDVADSNLTLGTVTMTPKTYQSSTSVSRQLIAQASSANVDIENLQRKDLSTDCAIAVDYVGINGQGPSANQPTGILAAAGVQAYTLINDTTGNGAKPVWDDFMLMQEMIEDVNADLIGRFSWLTTPGIKSLCKRTPRLLYAPAGGTVVNVTGDPIWAKGDEIDGLDAAWSNQVPKTLTAGTSHTCHALILGAFASMINGMWGSGFEMVVDPYRLKKQGLIEVTTFIMTDWALRYPQGFVVAADCLKQ